METLAILTTSEFETDGTLSLDGLRHGAPDGEAYSAWVEMIEDLHNTNELSRLARALAI